VNEEKKFKYLETLTLNQDAFENMFGSIWGRAVALWLRHYATNRHDAGSIPDVYHWNF
jgi:hypothetical protein